MEGAKQRRGCCAARSLFTYSSLLAGWGWEELRTDADSWKVMHLVQNARGETWLQALAGPAS